MKEQGKFKLDDNSGKKVRDRYERLQKDFDENHSKESRMSGVGGEVGLVEELLSKMREDREGERQRLCEKKERIKERDNRKRKAGKYLIAHAKNFNGVDGEDVGSDGESDHIEEEYRRTQKKRRNVSHEQNVDGEIDRLSASLNKMDEKRIAVENNRLRMDEKRMEMEKIEREKDGQLRRDEMENERTIRREERESNSKLELENFSMMLQAASEFIRALKR